MRWSLVIVFAAGVALSGEQPRLDCARVTSVTRGADYANGDQRWTLRGSCVVPPVETPPLPALIATTWAPGVRGIPVRSAVCATVAAGAPIQPAIDACPAGQVVQLEPGTWTVNDHLRLHKGITLRGAGVGQTVLRKTDGAREGTYLVDDQEPVVIVGAARWPHVDEETDRDLTADAVAGARSVTVSDPSGFVAGGFALVDEDDYGAAAWLPVSPTERVWASDRVVYAQHDPPRPGDDPFPASLTWFSRAGRPVAELKEIASVDGSVVTFTTPLHAGYRRARRAQLTRLDTPHVRLAGIEDLTIEGGGDGNLRFEAAAYSWAKNIRSTSWAGAAIDVQHSFRVEIRDSLIDHTVWPYPGGAGYGISLAWGSSEILIENNAIKDVNKALVMRSSGAGSVVGYNAIDDGHIGNFRGWQEVGLNASHMGGSHHVLFEGNDAFNYDSDNTHGTSWAITVFRNWLRGRRSSHPDESNVRTVGLMAGSWHHAVVGNVLGEPGRMSGWAVNDSLPWNSQPAIWRIGYDPGAWHLPAEPQTVATLWRDGNYDYVTGATWWSAGARALPDSLYLTARPAWLPAWPVDPTAATKTHPIPARERLEETAMLTPVLDTFNRADSGTLGANWTDIAAGWGIVSNRARGSVAGQAATWNAATYNGTVEVHGTLGVEGGTADLLIYGMERSSDFNGYAILYAPTGGGDFLEIYTVVGGTVTALLGASEPVTINTTDRFGLTWYPSGLLEAWSYVGTTRTVLFTRTDTTYAISNIRLTLAETNATMAVDDFGGGSVGRPYYAYAQQ